MSGFDLLVGHAVKIATLLTLIGIIGRHRYRTSLLFPVYLVAILAGNSLPTFWPATFYTQWFWILKQAVYDILKLGVALELGYRIFRAYPGTHRRALTACAMVLGITTVAIIHSSIPVGGGYQTMFTQFYPRVAAGTIWMLIGIVALVAWYRLPIERFHRAILLGFSSFLLVFTTIMNLLRDWGYDRLIKPVAPVGTVAYLAVMVWWAWVALTPDGEPEVAPAKLLDRLVPVAPAPAAQRA
jgi:hypothetical protein